MKPAAFRYERPESVEEAVANAVADALGVESVELPLTPARVWELIER